MIQNLKDLEKLLKLCRRQGVQEIDLGTVKFKLGDLPQEQTQSMPVETDSADPYAHFPDRILSNEELAFYSAGGQPGEEPEFGTQ